MIKADGTQETYSFVSGLSLTVDDVVRVITSSGAGFGDPKRHDSKAVDEDIKNGLISKQRAKELYG